MKRHNRTRRRLLVLGIALLITGACFLTFFVVRESARQRSLLEARAQGLEQYERGEYEAALPNLSRVVRHDPADMEALLAFAAARSKVPTENNRHLAESISLYSAAIFHEPQNMTALEGLLALQERAGRRVEWLDTADHILAIEPDHVEALRLKALGHAAGSDLAAAQDWASRLIAIEPEVLRWRVLILQLLREAGASTGDLITMCEQWIDESRRSERALDGRFHMLKAGILLTAGERDRAKEMARIAASPEHGAAAPEVLENLLSLLDALQLQEEAHALATQTQSQFADAHWPHEAVARRHWQHGHADAALEAIDHVRQTLGQLNVSLMRLEVLLLVQKNEISRAENVLATLDALSATRSVDDRDAHRAWIEAVRTRIAVENDETEHLWRDATEVYRHCLALAPDDPLLHYLIGEAQLQLGEFELARSHFERAVSNDPNWLAAQLLHAETLLRLGRSEMAARLTADLVRRIEDPPFGLYVLFARAWMTSGLTARELGIVATGDSAAGPDSLDPAHFLEVLRHNAPRGSAETAQIIQLLVDRLVHQGNDDRAAEVIEEVLMEERPDASVLMSAAKASARARLGFEQRLIDRAVEQVGMTIEVAEVQARLLHQAGRSAEGRGLLENALKNTEEGSADRLLAQRVLTAYLVEVGSADAAAALAALLDQSRDSAADIAFVLSQPLTWRHEELARRGVDMLANVLGDSSIRVSLAQAALILQFDRKDPARMARALVMVNDVLRRTPESIGALTLMSALHLSSTPPDVDAAVRQLQRAVRAQPRRADLYPQLIALMQRQGNFDAAQGYLQRLGELAARQDEVRLVELQLLESQGDFQTIISRLGEQLASGASEQNRAMLLAALHRADRLDEAHEIAQTLIESPHLQVETLEIVSHFMADTGQIDEAMALLEGQASLTAFEKLLLLGKVQQRAGRDAEAEHSLRTAAQLQPDDARAWDALAQHYIGRGAHREARDAARSGLKSASDHHGLQAKLALASLAIGGQSRDEAISLIERLRPEDHALAHTLSLYARIASRAEQVPEPRDLDEALRLVNDYPACLPAWRLAIAAHAQCGALEEAADLAERSARRFPTHAEPAELATRLFLRLGRRQHALYLAEQWRARTNSRTLEPDAVIASLLIDLGRPAAASARLEKHLDRIVRDRVEHPDHLRIALRALLHDGKTDRAIAITAPLYEQGEHWAAELVSVAREIKQDPASQLLLQLEHLAPNDPAIRLALAQEWMRLGATTEVAAHLDRAERHAIEAAASGEAPAAHLHLVRGLVHDFRNDLEAAASHYRKAIAIDPDNAIALNNLADVLLRTGESAREAMTLSARAASLLPDHPDVLDTHAQALCAAGRFAEAEQTAARALQQRRDDVGALLTLARIQLAQDRAEEAAALFHRASAAMSSSAHITVHVRTRHHELERAILAAHTDTKADS